MFKSCWALGGAILWLAWVGTPAAAAPLGSSSLFHLYIGTYTGAKSKGIYVCRFDAQTGRLGDPELAAETANPTFLAVHPNRQKLYSVERPLLYAANETGGGGRPGSVGAYAVDRISGRLSFLNRESSGGAGPCHLSVDATGQAVLVANYGGGSVALLPLRNDGSLTSASAFIQHHGSSVNRRRQEGPHAHYIQPDPSNRFALVCDLGLDQVLVYRLDAAKGTLNANDPPFANVKAGAGPRHLAFHPHHSVAYVINELDSTITAFTFDKDRGVLRPLQSVSCLPIGFTNQNTTAEVEVHPSGRYLYGSNRGHDSIAVFLVDAASGRLTPAGHCPTGGRTPRHFALDPSGQWLLAANQGTDNVVVFRVNDQNGQLSPTGYSVAVGAPVCLAFVPVK